jgi:hypothetical protein
MKGHAKRTKEAKVTAAKRLAKARWSKKDLGSGHQGETAQTIDQSERDAFDLAMSLGVDDGHE